MVEVVMSGQFECTVGAYGSDDNLGTYLVGT